MTRTGKVRAALAIAGVLVSMLAVQVAFEGAAQARCNGNHAINSDLKIGSEVLVQEQPVVGTCNGNNTYQALVKGGRSGWYPTVWVQNNNVWTRAHTGTSNKTFTQYSFGDNNSHSLMHFCLSTDTRLGYGTWICGWGSSSSATFTHQFNGINQGF